MNLLPMNTGKDSIKWGEPNAPTKLDFSNAELGERSLEKEQLKDIISNRNLREEYAKKVLRFLYIYCAVVVTLLILQGFHIYNFKLADLVVVTLVGGTAISVIGLVGFVIRGLFR